MKLIESDRLGHRRRRVTTASGHLSVIDEGAGAPVVLLHGAPMTALGFARVIEPLRHTHRVIAPDLPGFGDSTASPEFTGRLGDYADSIVQLMDALDLADAVLYLNDSSACMGLAAAAARPERIRGLVIADTVPIPLTGRAWLVKLVLRHIVGSWPLRALNRRFNLFAWLVANVAPLWRPLPVEMRKAMRAEFDTSAKRDRILDVFEAMGTDDAFMKRTELAVRDHLSSLPALVIYGQLDPMRLVGGPGRFAELFPRSQRAIVSLEEHFPILGSGHRIAEIVSSWIETELCSQSATKVAA